MHTHIYTCIRTNAYTSIFQVPEWGKVHTLATRARRWQGVFVQAHGQQRVEVPQRGSARAAIHACGCVDVSVSRVAESCTRACLYGIA